MSLQPTPANRGARPGFFTSGPLRPFSYPQFRLLWAASLTSMMPFLIGMAARGWLVLEMTDSPFKVTAVQGVLMLPMALFTPFGGVIADRLNRKMVLIVGDVANIFIFGVLALLLFADVVQVWHVFLAAFLNGATFAMSMPTRATVVHDVLGPTDVARGVGIYTTVFAIAQLAGPALAGYAMARNPDQLGWPFLVGAAFLVPAIAFLTRLEFPKKADSPEAAQRPSVVASIVEGLAYVRGRSLLVGLVLMSVVLAVFGLPYQTLLPVFARDILDTGPAGLGYLLAATGAGSILGSLAIAFFSSSRQLQTLILGTGFLFAPTVTLFAFSQYFPASLALALFLGWLLQVYGVGSFAVVQVGTDSRIRGRVIGIMMLAWGFGPAGMFLLGFGAEVLDPKVALLVMAGMSFVLISAVVLAVPALRRMAVEMGDRGPSLLEEALSPEPAVSAEDN